MHCIAGYTEVTHLCHTFITLPVFRCSGAPQSPKDPSDSFSEDTQAQTRQRCTTRCNFGTVRNETIRLE